MTDPVEPDIRASESEPVAAQPVQRTALTINIHSWATPIVGLVMFLLGWLGGFFVQSLIEPDRVLPTQEIQSVQPASPTSQANPNPGEVMQMVSAETRHFSGSEDAPVTIIEFSDYQ